MNNGFFDLEGPLFTTMTKIVDIIWLSILYILCCLPVITIGAATTALYYTVHKTIRHGRGYATKEYFKSFGSNFKQATIITLLLAVLYALLVFETYMMYQYALAGQGIGKIYIVIMILIALLTIWAIYIFAYLARFKNTTKLILKNSAYFAVTNFSEAVLLLLVFILFAFLIAKWMWLLLLLPSLYMLAADFLIERVFRKYMTPEDLADEEERDKVYKE